MDDELKRISLVIFGIVALLALVGFILLFSETTKTGNAVAKVVSPSKSTTTTKSTTPTQKETTTTQSTSLTDKKATTLIKDTSQLQKRTSPFNPPVSSLPQPSPGDRDSDAELVGCTTCAKEFEYRAMEGMCGGTLDDTYRHEDAGLELHCIRSDIYDDYYFTGRAPIFNIGARAKCQTPYNWIVSYGAECPSSSILTRIGPTTGAIRPYEDSWTPMPLVGEVEVECQRVPADSSRLDRAYMRIYITCMREKRSN